MLASTLLLVMLIFQGGGQERQVQSPNPQPSPTPGQPAVNQGPGQTRPQPQPTPTPEEPPVVTRHSIQVGGRTINYTATTGLMPIKNREGEVEARMFFTSYVVDRAD